MRTRLILVLFGAVIIAAGTLRASPARALAGADDCTKLASPETVQSLVQGATSGDVICMTAGVFRGPIILDGKSGVTLRGQGPRVTVVAGGARDGVLVLNSRDISFEDFTLFFGTPANAYVRNSTEIAFRRMDIGGGTIGLHFDENSRGTISDSFIYAMSGDGVLTRDGANVTIERNWIFVNAGVGVSTVGRTANTTLVSNIISDNGGPGVFAGQTPCALLPPGFVEVPECYLRNLAGYVGSANVILDTNIIQASGSTGVVLFPGTRGTFRNNRIWRNELSGVFVWGASVSSEGDQYDGNEEHAIELRAFPDPLKYPEIPSSLRVRAVGTINNNEIRGTVVLPQTGTLGGGVLAQGANVTVTNSRVYGNRGIGVSYVNTSTGRIENNRIFDNRGSGICLYLAGSVITSGNTLTGNADDRVGVCRETTP